MFARVPGLPILDWPYLKPSGDSRSISAVFDAPFQLWTTSGRAAIALALMNAGLRPGDGILLPTYHCPTMVSPASHLGLDIEFYPLVASGAPNLNFISRRLEAGRIRTLLVVHYFGFPQPIRALRELCNAHGVLLIEDCAHAMFGMADEQPIGTWGDYATVSLTKFLPITWGGCLVSHRHPLGDHLRHNTSLVMRSKKWLDAVELAALHERPAGVAAALRMLFRTKNFVRGVPDHGASLEPLTAPGEDNIIFRFDERSALTIPPKYVARAANNANRKRIIERRRRAYQRLANAIAPLPGLTAVQESLPDTIAPYVFPVLAERPDDTFRQARRSGIPVFRWDWLWPGTPADEEDVGAMWSRNLLQLPCHQDLSDAEIERIARAIAPPESSV